MLGLDVGDLRYLLDGAVLTVQLTVVAVIVGTVLGFIGGVLSLSDNRVVRWFVRVYVEVFRGVAAIILLFWAFYALPQLLDFRLSPFEAGVLALGTNMGAYGTELARGGIQAVPKGQTEAGIAVNLTYLQRLRHVILPQAVVIMLPSFGNLCIEVMKATALAALITANDLLYNAQILRSADPPQSPQIYALILVMYFVISGVITVIFRALERYFSRGRDIATAV